MIEAFEATVKVNLPEGKTTWRVRIPVTAVSVHREGVSAPHVIERAIQHWIGSVDHENMHSALDALVLAAITQREADK